MSLIFTERNIELILQGKKTQTRRIWKRIKVKKGGIYKIRRHIFSKKHYGLIQVTNIRDLLPRLKSGASTVKPR